LEVDRGTDTVYVGSLVKVIVKTSEPEG